MSFAFEFSPIIVGIELEPLTDAILIFLLVATVAGVISSKLGMPALTGEIFTGFLLGPPLGEFEGSDPPRFEMTFGRSHQLLLYLHDNS